jgi:hypothetical protein
LPFLSLSSRPDPICSFTNASGQRRKGLEQSALDWDLDLALSGVLVIWHSNKSFAGSVGELANSNEVIILCSKKQNALLKWDGIHFYAGPRHSILRKSRGPDT